MKGRRRRGCGRWRPRLALAQHFAQPGRPSMPVHFVVAVSRAPFSWTLGALISEKYGRFHSCKYQTAQSNKLAPISFALCVMKGRRRRECGRWRLRLALAQHVAQPGRPSMPVHFVVAGSRAPISWTLGALIIEKYGRFHSCKCHAAQSNKLPPISFALCVRESWGQVLH